MRMLRDEDFTYIRNSYYKGYSREDVLANYRKAFKAGEFRDRLLMVVGKFYDTTAMAAEICGSTPNAYPAKVK